MKHLTIETPNMDGFLSADEVLEVQKEVDSLRDGLRDLSRYCEAKSDAMMLREAGNIQDALLREQVADSIFKRLPPELRW